MNERRIPDGSPSSHRDWVEEIVERYQRPLLAYAGRLLHGDHAKAQDAVQETFLRLCKEDAGQLQSRVAAWLFTVCRSRVIDMQRSPGYSNKGHAMNSIDQVPIADPTPDASRQAEDKEQTSRLAELVNSLTPRQQEVIRLRLQADLSYREIAEVTGMTVSNVGFHLHAAVRSLRDAMNAV